MSIISRVEPLVQANVKDLTGHEAAMYLDAVPTSSSRSRSKSGKSRGHLLSKLCAVAAVAATVLISVGQAHAAAVRTNAGFTGSTLPRNDDGSTGAVNIGFTTDFYGSSFSQLFVNNNGNVTFDGALGTYTPFNLNTTNRQIIAPFFADVDTRNLASGVVQYGNDTVNGRTAFGVNWRNVGYYNTQAVPTNDFQLVLIDRSDTGAGNFDFEFNYDRILWETGSASGGGAGGLGGNSARAGFAGGPAGDRTTFELAGSAINGAFLDTNTSTGLIHNNFNSSTDGRYVFQVRNGQVATAPVPEPETWAMMGLGLIALVAVARRRKSTTALSVA